jgi:hypothetical protein
MPLTPDQGCALLHQHGHSDQELCELFNCFCGYSGDAAVRGSSASIGGISMSNGKNTAGVQSDVIDLRLTMLVAGGLFTMCAMQTFSRWCCSTRSKPMIGVQPAPPPPKPARRSDQRPAHALRKPKQGRFEKLTSSNERVLALEYRGEFECGTARASTTEMLEDGCNPARSSDAAHSTVSF